MISEYYGTTLNEETYMSYKPGKGHCWMKDGKSVNTPPDEYVEDTSLLRTDRGPCKRRCS